LSEVGDDPVELPREGGSLTGGNSTALGDKALERRGDTIERLLEEFDLLRRALAVDSMPLGIPSTAGRSSLMTRRRTAISG